MERIRDWAAFIRRATPFLADPDPLASMRRNGFEADGAVATDLQRARPGMVFLPDTMHRLQADFGSPPPIHVRVGPAPLDEPPSVATGYGLTMSAEMTLLNQILAELWRVGTIPHEIAESSALTIDLVRQNCVGVPADATTGLIQIGAPLAKRSNVSDLNLAVHVDWTLPIKSPGVVQPVALFGAAIVEVPLEFEIVAPGDSTDVPVDEPKLRLSQDANDSLFVSLTIPPISPLQFRSDASRRTFEFFFTQAIVALMRKLRAGPLTVKPSIDIAKRRFPNSAIDIVQVGAATKLHRERAYVVAGVNVENRHDVHPAALATQPLPEAPDDFHALADQAFASDALSSVITSGDLAAFINRVIARYVDPISLRKVVVTSGSIAFEDNRLRVFLDCVMVDACPLGKDLKVKASVVGRPKIENGTLTIETKQIDLNVDNTDAIICTILGALLGPLGIVVHAAAIAFIAAFNPTSKNLDIPVAETSEPLPGSDKVVDLELTSAHMSPNVLAGDGRLQLISDPLRVYVYLRIVQARLPHQTLPLAGATVELYELDKPAPEGDDVNVPATGITEKERPKFTITTEMLYNPRADELLSTGTTDENGRVTFVAISNMIGGVKTTNRTKTDARTNEIISQSTARQTIREDFPDLGVTIRSASGELLASRRLIALNVENKRFGTFDRPVDIRVSDSTVSDPTVG